MLTKMQALILLADRAKWMWKQQDTVAEQMDELMEAITPPANEAEITAAVQTVADKMNELREAIEALQDKVEFFKEQPRR